MSKQDKNSLYEQQEEKIRAQSDAFIGILTKRGILGDQDVDDEKIRAAQQEKKKAAYHNTLVLLQQYRNIAWMLECFPSTVAEELDQPFEDLDELIDRVDVEMAMGNRKLENRIGSIQKSRLMLDRVNEALTVLRKKPKNGEQLYNLIYLTYIAPEKLSITEMLYQLDMSSRQYYRLREQAITILSLRLWASPKREMDVWLDVLTLLESMD